MRRESNFYTGRFELAEDGAKVVHIGLQSSAPGVVGQRMERDIEILGDGRLMLSGTGIKERVMLVWTKVA
ncbi:MAG TPA: hypothetical protein VEC06_00585 [Paucimonas sp.]|nr:hypothetical protein [Paucimonas sp.]